MSENFFENLKNARLRKGLSQVQLAEQLGIAKSTYSMYESGKREPNMQTIKKIADILDVSTDELLGMDELCDYALQVIAQRTIAAHLDTDDLTEAELKDVANYIEFIKSKRQ